MTDKPSKRWVPEPGGALHRKPIREAAAKLKREVLDQADDIFDRYISGQSLETIGRSLPSKIAGWKLRDILMNSDETREHYANTVIYRAHALVEQAIEHGVNAAAIGDAAGLRTAIDVNLKVASKLAPRDYGDTRKVELTGKDGAALEIKADLSLTAEQAYERLIKGE